MSSLTRTSISRPYARKAPQHRGHLAAFKGMKDSKQLKLLSWAGLFTIVVMTISLLGVRPTRIMTTVVIAMFASFMMAWANAANDIANSVGTQLPGNGG